ncbi:cation:proton antiporter [Candidatus Micrarchaeota archaeon]|nr:cation:proton antiporter [Candidatus Micrarchaeota archaeon]
MAELLSFLVLISASLFLSELFRRFHLPYVVALILAGIIIGPYGLALFEMNETIDFLGSIGLVFLMFMAGMEIKLSSFRSIGGSAARFALINGAIPFLAGFGIASFFGYDTISSLLLGIIFVSSSIAVVIPVMESTGLINMKLGKTIVAGTIVEDVLSLILLSLFLQSADPTSEMPLPLFYLFVFILLAALRILMPRAREWFFSLNSGIEYHFEQELRFILVMLVGTVVLFDLLGMHSIIAGFFAGLVLSDSITNETLRRKLHAVSYGIFIPVFFIIIGTQMDVSILSRWGSALYLVLAIAAVSVISKFASGWLAAKSCGFDSKESALAGVSTIPQLSTTLAVAFVGLEMGLLDDNMITAMIILSIATTFIGPILMSAIARTIKEPPQGPIGHPPPKTLQKAKSPYAES